MRITHLIRLKIYVVNLRRLTFKNLGCIPIRKYKTFPFHQINIIGPVAPSKYLNMFCKRVVMTKSRPRSGKLDLIVHISKLIDIYWSILFIDFSYFRFTGKEVKHYIRYSDRE